MILSHRKIESICRAVIAPPANLGASGALSLGRKTVADLSEATYAYEARVKMHGAAGADLTLTVRDGDMSSNTYAAFQRETAAVVGTASGSGTVRATITSANVTGSPIIIDVPVTDGMVNSTIAGLLREAMAANAAINAVFEVGGGASTIQLIRRIYAANDATLNIAISQPTGSGITPAATSTNTTAGVAGTEIISPAYPNSDAFGIALGVATEIVMCQIQVTGGSVVMTQESPSPENITFLDGTILTTSFPTPTSLQLTFTQTAGSPLIEALFFCK
jgi:hypothetical protein